MGIIGNRDESLFLLFSELWLAIHQITIGIDILATDSTTELMETCESEFFWIDNNNSIGSKKIDSILDDGSGEEDIVFSLFEGMNSIFDLVSWHLTMSDDDSRNF